MSKLIISPLSNGGELKKLVIFGSEPSRISGWPGLTNRPARREDDKVSDGRAGPGGGTCQHREDGGVAVVVTHTVDHTELGQVVLKHGGTLLGTRRGLMRF